MKIELRIYLGKNSDNSVKNVGVMPVSAYRYHIYIIHHTVAYTLESKYVWVYNQHFKCFHAIGDCCVLLLLLSQLPRCSARQSYNYTAVTITAHNLPNAQYKHVTHSDGFNNRCATVVQPVTATITAATITPITTTTITLHCL